MYMHEFLVWLVEILNGTAYQIFVDAVGSLEGTEANEIRPDLYHFFGPTRIPTSLKDV
jgi:hypothetical protein